MSPHLLDPRSMPREAADCLVDHCDARLLMSEYPNLHPTDAVLVADRHPRSVQQLRAARARDVLAEHIAATTWRERYTYDLRGTHATTTLKRVWEYVHDLRAEGNDVRVRLTAGALVLETRPARADDAWLGSDADADARAAFEAHALAETEAA